MNTDTQLIIYASYYLTYQDRFHYQYYYMKYKEQWKLNFHQYQHFLITTYPSINLFYQNSMQQIGKALSIQKSLINHYSSFILEIIKYIFPTRQLTFQYILMLYKIIVLPNDSNINNIYPLKIITFPLQHYYSHYFDNIFVINLKSNVYRKKLFLINNSPFFSHKPIFVNAIETKQNNLFLTYYQKYQQRRLPSYHIYMERYTARYLTINELSLLLTYRSILRYALSKHMEHIIIFEDDAVLHKNIINEFNQLYLQIPDNWDCIFLGIKNYSLPLLSNSRIHLIHDFHCGAHAILLSHKFIYNFLEYLQTNIFLPLDENIKYYNYYQAYQQTKLNTNILPELNMYVIDNPSLSITYCDTQTPSSIQSKHKHQRDSYNKFNWDISLYHFAK